MRRHADTDDALLCVLGCTMGIRVTAVGDSSTKRVYTIVCVCVCEVIGIARVCESLCATIKYGYFIAGVCVCMSACLRSTHMCECIQHKSAIHLVGCIYNCQHYVHLCAHCVVSLIMVSIRSASPRLSLQ